MVRLVRLSVSATTSDALKIYASATFGYSAQAWRVPEPAKCAAVDGRVNQRGGDMIRLILVGAAGYMLWTRPELRERVLGFTREFFDRLTAVPPRR
jgi:hypothetical protein